MLIELENVTKTYGKVEALRGLSVAVPEGAIGLLGPNGAGKTTMIRTLLGLISLDSGSGRVLGMDIRLNSLAIRQAVGLVPEDECLFPGMTGVGVGRLCGRAGGHGARATPSGAPTRCSTTSGWARRGTAGPIRTRPG